MRWQYLLVSFLLFLHVITGVPDSSPSHWAQAEVRLAVEPYN